MQQVTHWLPLEASAAIGAHRIVQVSGKRKVSQASAAASAVIGVNGRTACEAGKTCDVAVSGVALVEVGAAVTQGAMLKSDAMGRAVDAAAANDRLVGVALQVGAQAGDLVSVLLSPGTR